MHEWTPKRKIKPRSRSRRRREPGRVLHCHLVLNGAGLRYWLGVSLHSTAYSCPECHSTADPFGDHQVGCDGNGDRLVLHNAICDELYCAAQSAALAPSREMPHLIFNSLSRPAYVFIPTWSRGRPAALDIHVISPLQQQTLGQASLTPGHALEFSIQRKLTSHLTACQSAGVDFIPL